MELTFGDLDLGGILTILINAAIWFYHSWIFVVFKWFLIVYSVVLLLDVVMLLILRGVGSDIRVGIKGMDLPIVSPRKMRKRWSKIAARLQSNQAAQYKIAVLEADLLVDEMLAGIGYQGQNMGEKLEQIKEGQLDYLEELKNAHALRNRIVQEVDFELSKQTAEEILEVYEAFLKYLEYL